MKINNDSTHVSTIQNNIDKASKMREVHENSRNDNESQQSTSQREIIINKEEVKSTVDKLNTFNDPVYTNLKFVLHEDLHEYYVEVINPQTDEVFREIPPKKMLDMYAAMAEYMGLLVDEKV